jgi:uncharacterized protein DUF1924
MQVIRSGALCAAAVLALNLGHAAIAATPGELLAALERSARASDPAFAGFSAERGAAFFKSTHGHEWSCASCHTDHPAAQGRHAKTAKPIEPLAPAANPQRFSDAAKVDKWFKRNCNDVLGRVCTPREQGDVLTYLTTVRP